MGCKGGKSVFSTRVKKKTTNKKEKSFEIIPSKIFKKKNKTGKKKKQNKRKTDILKFKTVNICRVIKLGFLLIFFFPRPKQINLHY